MQPGPRGSAPLNSDMWQGMGQTYCRLHLCERSLEPSQVGAAGVDAHQAKPKKTQPLDEPIMKDGRAEAMSFGESTGGTKQPAQKNGATNGDNLMPPGTEAY